MFTHYRTRAFIFKKSDSGEASRLFSAYAKDFGRLELLAKSVRKIKSKLRAGLDIFYLSEIEFIQGKAHKTITDAILIKKFGNIRKDLDKLKIAYQIAELFDNLVKEQEPDETVWQLLNETFDRLDKSADKFRIIYYYLFWNLLSLLGYCPELYHCSLCRKKILPGRICFDPREGGLICGQCRKTGLIEIPDNAVKIIRILLNRDWPVLRRLRVDEEDFDQLEKISQHCFSRI